MPSVVITQNNVSFVQATSAQYASLTPKDANTIYFITDTKDIYVGDSCYTSDNVVFTDSVPEFDTASDDVIYVVKGADGNTIYVKGDSDMEQAGGSSKVSIDDLTDILEQGASGDNTKIPTVGAVEEKITEALSGYSGAIVNVSADRSEDNSGTVLTFTPKEGEPIKITVADLFLSAASYDSDSHKLSLTVTGAKSPVEVDLGELIPQAVSTTDVAMSSNIVCTVDVGNYKKGETIDISSTDTLQKFLVGMLSQDSNPTTTQPSASITLTGAGAKEVGTNFTPQYSASLNPGSYSNNAEGAQPTNVTATSWTVTDTDENTAATQTGSFTAFTVADDTNYHVSVSVAHTAGAVPTTFLGEPYAAGQIKAGTKTANSSSVTGYRMGFYGSLTDKSGSVTSALIRGLSGKSNKKVAKGQKYTISVPSGTQRIIVAYDATIGDVASITSAEQFGSEIKDSFVKSTVSVEGANAYTGINYNVYVKDLAAPQGTATTYTLTI